MAFVERREHERFKVKNGAIVMIRPLNSDATTQKYCLIMNISKDGLAFRYIDRNGELNEPFKLNVSFAQDSISFTYLKYVPCKTVWTSHEASKPSSSHLKTMQRGVQFGEMTPNHASQLDRFIQKYAIR
jgi:hypothetical protein